MPHALLVDDDADTLESLQELVAREGFTVATASSLKAARENMALQRPDVVLLDLSMPDINGIEVAKQMSASDPTVPLILFTILEIEGIESAAREAGIRAIVPKIEAWNLIGSIESLVAQKSRPQTQ